LRRINEIKDNNGFTIANKRYLDFVSELQKTPIIVKSFYSFQRIFSYLARLKPFLALYTVIILNIVSK